MERILVVRVDKLGDFCHSLPAISLLKRSLPDAQIDVIVSPIIEPLAKQFDFIDNLLIYRKDDPQLVDTIKQRNYQAALIMHSHKHMAQVVKQANIPYRLGQRRKWFQYLYTHRAPLNRSACLKPEWRYCTDHIEYFLCKHHIPPADIHQRLWDIAEQKPQWQEFYGKTNDELMVFIHPGSGGSEGSLSPAQFVDIADNLAQNCQHKLKFVVTFGPGEEQLADTVAKQLQDKQHDALPAKPIKDIAEFSRSLVAADVMIAGSTGPLHVASLHNAITVGFYPHESRDDKIRWQTLSDDYKRLSFSPPMGKSTGANLALVDTKLAGTKAAEKINALYGDN
ncbi:glycosyltransferase family 9 protein [Shewanella sp. WXL01]|uniref:glycosyltransferase family 9 protein n=1 Tax=Shewanella sp. WXL01 TaxID=2709721 RepID=UPI00143847DC|nr:glycosyltransferase family 9 protein [Shewanella sp. WXL01]NKF52060.1 glycosyltransferase family 9 protein [Shewanella sp. WXL01]